MANSAKKINKESTCRTIAVAATPIIILGGICIGFGWRYVRRAWKSEKNHVRSVSLAALHGGKLALDRLVDYQKHRGKATETDVDIKELETQLGKEHSNFKELQRVLARLEMSRREDEAIKVLNKALKKAKRERKSHEAYEIEMLLAEMYIYKGDFEKAAECKCLAAGEEEKVSDPRIPLYKAIINLINQKEQDARQHWAKFRDEMQELSNAPSFQEEEFLVFKNAVLHLKEDINAARQLKKL
ncbi:uncharacterized protein LOC110424521 [Herrania umbratica]|uniref:Uncharacterized protein LOC110424521 n=1 Tax=Herrania umbratica TaxID=108875 RepID=A0A6J1B8D3_9ROSI|nr:uncharacterized protein LOC110424521 [Herrania umbratica]